MMVLMMLNSACQPGFLRFSLNLKVETIVLQVLTAYYYIIIKTVMENESGKSVHTRGPLTIYHPSTYITVWWKWHCTTVVVLIFLLVEEGDGDLSCEGPWQVVIVPSFHEVGIHWDMSVWTTTSSTGINPDAHLVTSRVGVEWRNVPFLFGC